MNDKEWLQKLQPGDTVVLSGQFGLPGTVETVERVTKTQIILKGSNSRYRRDDGFLKGGSVWNNGILRKPTPERVKKIHNHNRRRKIQAYINNFCWGDMPLESLEKVYALLKGLEDQNDLRSGIR